MRTIYDAISQVGDNELFDQNRIALDEAMRRGDTVLAEQIIAESVHIARQLIAGNLSLATQSSVDAPVHLIKTSDQKIH